MASNSSSVSRTGSFEKYLQYPSPGIFGKVALYFFYLFSDKRKSKGVVQPPYGIRMYVGLPGTGKTVSMVEYLLTLRATYPGIKIYTNFGFQYQDGDIVSLDDFQRYNDPNGVVFAVDELQLSFQARQFNKFPSEMIFLLTQNRKFKKHFVCTAQLFEHVDKVFRDLTNVVIQCKNWGARWFFQKAYTTLDYRVKINPDGEKQPFILWCYSFIANDFIFNAYDTYKIVAAFTAERAKDRQDQVELGTLVRTSLSASNVVPESIQYEYKGFEKPLQVGQRPPDPAVKGGGARSAHYLDGIRGRRVLSPLLS